MKLNTNESKLQYERIKRMILSSPRTLKRDSNSRLTYSIVKRIIETSPLERKLATCKEDSPIDLSSKNINTLESFCGRQKAISQTRLFNAGTVKEEEPKFVEKKPKDAKRKSKAGKAQIFVGKIPRNEKVKTEGAISPVARGKSWITVKVD